MSPSKQKVDLIWTDRDPASEARFFAQIEKIEGVEDLQIESTPESICSVSIQIDVTPSTTQALTQAITGLPGFSVKIQSVSAEPNSLSIVLNAAVEGAPSTEQQPTQTSTDHEETIEPISLHDSSEEWTPSEPLIHSIKWTGSSKKTRCLVFFGIIFNLIILASLFTGWLNLMSNDTHRRRQASDFFSIYQGSANIFHGRSVYADDGYDLDVPYRFGYRYIPSVAYTFAAPLLLIEPWNAYWIWVGLLEALLLLNIVLTRQMAISPNRANISTAMWLLFTPLYSELYMGQFSFVMASLFLWMMVGAWKLQPRTTKWTWIGSILLKSNSLLFAPALLRAGKIKFLILAAVVVALLNAPYFALNPGDLNKLQERNTGTATATYTQTYDAGGMGAQALVTIVGYSLEDRFRTGFAAPSTLSVALAPDPGWKIPFLWLMGPGVILGALIATFLVRKFDLLLNLTIWVSVYLIVFKDVWEHHYLMLLPFLILLFVRGKNGSTAALIAWLFLALPSAHLFIEWWIIAFDPTGIVRDTSFDPQVYWPQSLSILYHAVKPVPLIVFFLFLLRNSFSSGQLIPIRQNIQRVNSSCEHLWYLVDQRWSFSPKIIRVGRLFAKLVPAG